MPPPKIIAPDALAKAKRLYEETGTRMVEIAAALDVDTSWVYRFARRHGWRRHRPDRPRTGHDTRFNRANASARRRTPTKHIPASLIAQAKRLYLHTTVPTADICALLGIGTHTFHRRLKMWGWPLRSRRIPRDEPAESAAIGVERVPGDEAPSAPAYVLPDEIERKALAARLLRLAEQHIAASERAAASLEAQAPGDRAEDARAIAGLMRVVRAMSGVTRAKREHADEPDDPAFRSLEELGRAISAHLEAMESGAAGDVSREAAGG